MIVGSYQLAKVCGFQWHNLAYDNQSGEYNPCLEWCRAWQLKPCRKLWHSSLFCIIVLQRYQLRLEIDRSHLVKTDLSLVSFTCSHMHQNTFIRFQITEFEENMIGSNVVNDQGCSVFERHLIGDFKTTISWKSDKVSPHAVTSKSHHPISDAQLSDFRTDGFHHTGCFEAGNIGIFRCGWIEPLSKDTLLV